MYRLMIPDIDNKGGCCAATSLTDSKLAASGRSPEKA